GLSPSGPGERRSRRGRQLKSPAGGERGLNWFGAVRYWNEESVIGAEDSIISFVTPVANYTLVSPRLRRGGHAMKLPHRRNFLRLAGGAVTLPAASRATRAQSYPSRPVRWIVGFAPGGGNDIVARLMGQWLSERLGQPVVIENRPGAATNIATETVVRAPP